MASAGGDTPMVDPEQPANLFTFSFPYTPIFGWGKAPPTSASNPPPPPSGQGAPPSTSNSPPPPSGHGTSGSNPAPPPSRNSPPPPPRGQGSRNPPGAPPSGSNPAPPPASRPEQPQSSWAGAILLRPRLATRVAELQVRANPNPPPPSSRGQGHRSSGQGGCRPAPEPEPPAAAGEKRKSPHDEPGPQLRRRTGAVPNPGSALKRPRTDGVTKFEQRFSSPEDLDAQLTVFSPPPYHPRNSVYEQVAAFLHTARAMNSQTASDATQVGDHHLRSMYNAVATVGLHVFAPDVFGNPESLYNLAHEHVAIHSFRTIASLFAYSSIYRVDLSLIKDDHFLQRFYRSFIYGRMKDLASKEERRPGRVGVDIVLNNIYRHRDETQALHVVQITDDCFMNKTLARWQQRTSAIQTMKNLLTKPGRDSAVSAFFEVLTARRETAISQKRKKGAWRRRIRKRGLPPSDLSRARPTNVPIDYFSPQFFNDLSVRDRAIYMNNGWKGLGKVDFMAQYGKAKLALYELPTEAELAALDDDSMDDDD
ncbi:hypothetical protein B0H14DRAFT_3448980 [Mycena olivaceomarginata]|nr:hypothetical protein B0H14DRAFT_3448980 [Mycena olivaceomarginata]